LVSSGVQLAAAGFFSRPVIGRAGHVTNDQ
jgi:hypothetical protein